MLVRSWFAATMLLVPMCAAAPATPSAGQTDPLGHRLKLAFFQHAGAEQGESQNQIGRFKGVLRDKLTVLVEELPARDAQFAYLQQLSLDPPGAGGYEDLLSTEEKLQTYWNQSRSLVLIRGTLFTEPNGSYVAQSRLYLGGLRGPLAQPSVAVKMPIRCDEVPTTSDAHSLIVYYALARDATRMNDEPARIIELLNHARDKARDLKARNALTPALAEVAAAIDSSLSVHAATR